MSDAYKIPTDEELVTMVETGQAFADGLPGHVILRVADGVGIGAIDPAAPEDHSYYRDLSDVLHELNRLADEIAMRDDQIDNLREANMWLRMLR